jgi:hypothetical protein
MLSKNWMVAFVAVIGPKHGDSATLLLYLAD